MDIVGLVPVKSLPIAKSRLCTVLSPDVRAALVREMLRDVIGALTRSGCLGDVVVLTDDPHAREIARAAGCAHRPDVPGIDLSGQLNLAARSLRDEGVAAILVIPADVPCVQPGDVRDLIGDGKAQIVICPAESDGGTNALMCSPPDGLTFAFGPQSSRRHVQMAQLAGHRVRCVRLERMRDIDRPDDLAWLAREGRGTNAWQVLAGQERFGQAAGGGREHEV